jgi:hypothetical protein
MQDSLHMLMQDRPHMLIAVCPAYSPTPAVLPRCKENEKKMRKEKHHRETTIIEGSDAIGAVVVENMR